MKYRVCTSLTAVLLVLGMLTACGDGSTSPPPSRGVWRDNVYTNASIGLSFTNPDGWTVMSDEDISTLMEQSITTMSQGTTSASIQGPALHTTHDMMTFQASTGNNISISYEALADTVGSTKTTETQYFDILKNNLTSTGIYAADNFSEITKVTVGGQIYQMQSASAEATDSIIRQTYLIRKQGDYMVVIIITRMDDHPVSELLECFSSPAKAA